MDAFHNQLSMINIPFDIIGISETKHQINKDFLVNVDMQRHSIYTQPSKSSCGGCQPTVRSSCCLTLKLMISLMLRYLIICYNIYCIQQE